MRLDHRGTKDNGLGRAWTVTPKSWGVPEGLQAAEEQIPGSLEDRLGGDGRSRGCPEAGVPRSIHSEGKGELVLSDVVRWGLTPHLCHHHL